MAMTRTLNLACALLLAACGCSAVSPKPKPETDCSVLNRYDFSPINEFSGGDTNWFSFADSTPRATPDLTPPAITNLQLLNLPAPGRCGDTLGINLKASGHNFYGVGYGDYGLATNPKDGTGYEGISLWARSDSVDAGGTDSTFMLFVDDGSTFVPPPDPAFKPGDLAPNGLCRIPPPQSPSVPTPACYGGGVLPPGTPPRIPDKDECGNQFHTYVTVTETWQLILIPWSQLAQWPCPNRKDGGIDVSDISEIEIKFLQGTSYDVWIDNFEFYRLKH